MKLKIQMKWTGESDTYGHETFKLKASRVVEFPALPERGSEFIGHLVPDECKATVVKSCWVLPDSHFEGLGEVDYAGFVEVNIALRKGYSHLMLGTQYAEAGWRVEKHALSGPGMANAWQAVLSGK